ncbi:MAG: DUF4340 domain-containing protein [Alphaproteobacteria bacterium]|nr:DUF4340 domain-containing protein [Alphaproteobacteria bacterium]
MAEATSAARRRLSGSEKIVLALAAVALATTLAAILALGARASRETSSFAPRAMFPELASKLDAGDFGGLEFATKDARIVVSRTADGKWVLSEKGGYPVAEGALVGAVATVAGLELVEPKTKNPERHNLLGLVAPDKGGGARALTLKEKSGAPIASVLVGEEPLHREVGSRRAVYVRKAGEDATFLAYTDLALETDPSAWIATDGLSLARDRVSAVRVTPAEGPAYAVKKGEGEGAAFTLEGLGPEEELSSAYTLSTMAGALASPGIEDVAKAATLDFSKAARLDYETGDGLLVTARVARVGDAAWLTLDAAAKGDAKDDVKSQAEAMNARASGWAYKIATTKADQMTKARADLVRPKKAEETPAEEPGIDGVQSHSAPGGAEPPLPEGEPLPEPAQEAP